MVREKSGKTRFYSKPGLKSGSFVSGERVSKSLFKVSEFYFKVAANYFIRCFCIDKPQNYLIHPYFC